MRRIWILILIITTIIIQGCITENDIDDTIEGKKDTVIIGITSDIFGFHPNMEQYESTTITVNSNIYNGLVDFGDNFKIIPELATSWVNPNNLTWRFNLRKNVLFHNGYEFTAEDAKYSIDIVKDDIKCVLKDLLISVSEVVIVDNYTIDIITEKPCPILLNKLVDIPIISKKYDLEKTKDWPIGTGAYKLVEYVTDDHISLVIFDDYWKKDLEVKKVEFVIISNNEDIKNSLINGTIDIADYLLPGHYDEIAQAEGINEIMIDTPTVVYLGFDFREIDSYCFKPEKNPFTDIRVRKAVYHAIDIDPIIKNATNNVASPASQFVPPVIFGYNPNITRLSYDINKSLELMKEAGYQDGFEVELDCPQIIEFEIICNILKDQLSKINVSMKINSLSFEEYLTGVVINRNCSFFLMAWLTATGDGGEIFDYLLKTRNDETGEGNYNVGSYSNSEVDSIGEDIAISMNPSTRQNLMQLGFYIATQDYAYIPLYYGRLVRGSADYIDYNPNPDGKTDVEKIGFK